MIAKVAEKTITASGTASSAAFSIKSSNVAHIFGILRSQLYSDKKLALLREYSTNASDAHIEAKCPNRPIAVTLPTALYPRLIIRDFGHGLSEEDVYNVFASYGASTKRETNDQTGMLGLGSKSAFCYVNTFTVVSYQNGVKKTYNAYIDETSVGVIALMDKQDTDEEDGLEITIDVDPDDVRSFSETAKQFYVHFTPRPIIKNNMEVATYLDNYKKGLVLFSNANYELVKTVSYGESRAYVVMGNIRYPINTRLLDSDTRCWVDSLYNMSLCLNAAIGDVKIAASRESLEYDKDTLDYLNKAIELAKADIVAQVTDKLKKAKTLWEVRILLNTMKQNIGNLNIAPLWRGTQVTSLVVGSQTIHSLVSDSERFRRYHPHKDRLMREEILHPSDQVCILIDTREVPRNTLKGRIRQFIQDGFNGHVYLAQFDNAKQAKAFMTHPEIVGANVVDIATINYVAPKRVAGGKRGTADGVVDKQRLKVFKYKIGGAYSSVKSESWAEAEVDPKDGKGVYIQIHSFQAHGSKYVCELYTINRLLEALKLAGHEVDTLIGVRKNVEMGKGWVTLDAYAEKVLDGLRKDKNLQEYLLGRTVAAELSHNWLSMSEHASKFSKGKLRNTLEKLASLPKHDPKMSDKGRAYQKMLEEMRLRNTCTLGQKSEIVLKDYRNVIADCLKAYPLIGWCGSEFREANINKFIPYVKGVDGK